MVPGHVFVASHIHGRNSASVAEVSFTRFALEQQEGKHIVGYQADNDANGKCKETNNDGNSPVDTVDLNNLEGCAAKVDNKSLASNANDNNGNEKFVGPHVVEHVKLAVNAAAARKQRINVINLAKIYA